VFNHHLLAISI